MLVVKYGHRRFREREDMRKSKCMVTFTAVHALISQHSRIAKQINFIYLCNYLMESIEMKMN